MKVVHPSEVFTVVQFQPEMGPDGHIKYGPHSSGAHVVSGHEGPEAMFKHGDQTVHAKPGDVLLFGEHGGFRILKAADFEAMLSEGKLSVVPESPAPSNLDSGAFHAGGVSSPQEPNAQEAQVGQSEEVQGGVSNAGVQEGILEERFEERPESEVPQAGNRDRVEPSGTIEEEAQAGQNKVRRSKGA